MMNYGKLNIIVMAMLAGVGFVTNVVADGTGPDLKTCLIYTDPHGVSFDPIRFKLFQNTGGFTTQPDYTSPSMQYGQTECFTDNLDEWGFVIERKVNGSWKKTWGKSTYAAGKTYEAYWKPTQSGVSYISFSRY
jgi:hypothetical protein